jgi:hypothetical protein
VTPKLSRAAHLQRNSLRLAYRRSCSGRIADAGRACELLESTLRLGSGRVCGSTLPPGASRHDFRLYAPPSGRLGPSVASGRPPPASTGLAALPLAVGAVSRARAIGVAAMIFRRRAGRCAHSVAPPRWHSGAAEALVSTVAFILRAWRSLQVVTMEQEHGEPPLVPHPPRRRGGGVAARGEGAAASDARDWPSWFKSTCSGLAQTSRLPSGPRRSRFRTRQERGDRIPRGK